MIWLRVAQGVLSAIEIYGVFLLFHIFLEKRNNKLWSVIIFYITVFSFCYLTVYQREVAGMYSRYYMFLCIFFAAGVGKVFYRINYFKVLLITSLYFVLLSFWDLLFSYLYQILFNPFNVVDIIQSELNIKRILVMLISRTVLYISLLVIAKKKKVIRRVFSKYQVIFWSFVFLVYTGLYFCERIFYTPYRIQGMADVYFVLFPVFIMLFFLIIFIYIMYIEKKNEIELVNNQNEMIEKNYQEMLLLYQKRERVFHDMKNHLSVLSLLISEKDLERAESYINKINEPILELEHKKYTGNRIVDIILADKTEKAQTYDIPLEIKSSTLDIGRVHDLDWCSILANLMDNAIEACLKLDESERWIKVVLNQNECATMIEVSNSFNGIIKEINGIFESSKINKSLHGLGMKSVQSSVEKYNGILESRYERNIFTIYISLFLIKEE